MLEPTAVSVTLRLSVMSFSQLDTNSNTANHILTANHTTDDTAEFCDTAAMHNWTLAILTSAFTEEMLLSSKKTPTKDETVIIAAAVVHKQ